MLFACTIVGQVRKAQGSFQTLNGMRFPMKKSLVMLFVLLAVPAYGQNNTEKKKVEAELYGYIKLDTAYDTGRTDTGNYARWVLSEKANNNDNQLNMTANETRLGLKLKGPDEEGLETRGKVEIDFFEGGAENKPRPMMRHAYLELGIPEKNLTLLAGQTSDIFSPLAPQTVNYSVLWWVGNIGYRRPQIRLTKEIPLEGEAKVILAGGVARTIGETSGFDPGDSGEDSGQPTYEGRIGTSFPTSLKKPVEIGISGHWAKEEYDTDETGAHQDYRSWSGNMDFSLPLTSILSIKSELFYGQNLDTFLGGIGQGVNTAAGSEIASKGGWLELTAQATDALTLNIGASVDDPADDDLAAEQRSLNYTIFANSYYKVTSALTAALEVSYWRTKYIDAEAGKDIRTQVALIYYF